MSTKIGRFDVLSEITHSAIGAIYKATDPESGQTVALKAIKLELLGEQGAALVQSVLEEAEATKILNSHNIALLYGAGDIDGLFCASLEYVQGNSIGTMLARKEGFSIWDLQDIVRQTCQGLDHAHSHNVFHYSLEPAKIMVTWDGTVKVLGFGISAMGAPASQASGAPPEVLHYMSPEQLRGDPLDARSNVFSLGAILYEMVTERKAFTGEDADQVRQSILEMTPVAPDQINRKTHPVLSQVIMKAMAKSPEERYQSGQELVNELEKCKESATKSAAKKPTQPPQGLITPQKTASAASAPAAKPAPPKPAPTAATPVATAPPKRIPTSQPKAESAPAISQTPTFEVPPAQAASAESSQDDKKAAAAAAGWEGGGTTSVSGKPPRTPKLDPTEQFISSCVKATMEAATHQTATMSAATAEPEIETAAETSRIKIDPMMAEAPAEATKRASFSEMDELPPLKEVFVAPPPPPSVPDPVDETKATLFIAPREPEKPKIQPREVAKKAVKEIKKTPPKLFGYAVAGAVVVILLVIVVIAFRIHSGDSDDDTTTQSAASESTQPAVAPAPAPVAHATTPAPAPVPVVAEPITPEPEAEVSVKPRFNARKKTARTPSPAPQIIPGQLSISSTPEGAQVRIDGRSDPGWVTPYNMPGLTPGSHVITVMKAGFSTETRTLEVASGSKSFLVVQLAALAAAVSIGSEPAGAAVFIDGKDTGRVTPTQLSAEKPGNHTLTIKKQGYLDETTTANLQSGQTFHFAPTLRALGNVGDIKMGGRFKKMFGGGGDTSGMGAVSVKTQPKGAQITVNSRMLDKGSPVEFYLNPGTYVIDITASGFKPLHRVINVDKGGKTAIEETMERE